MSWFKLKRPVGASYQVNPDDILNTKTALSLLGYYQVPQNQQIGAWTDGGMFDGVRQFQKDNHLQADGVMRPGGDTERVLNAHLAGKAWQEQNANALRAGLRPNELQGPYVTTVAIIDAAVAVHAAAVVFNSVAVSSEAPDPDPSFDEDGAPEWE